MKLWSSGCQGKGKDTNSAMKSRVLSFFDLVTIGLGSSLAVGIFVLIGDLIKNVAGPAVVVSVSLAGVAALAGGLCFSEFGVRFVKVNSAYAYSYFWGRGNAAFLFGWILILEYVAGTASAARGIVTFIDALADNKISEFLHESVRTNSQDIFPYFDFFSFGILILLTVFIVFGLKDFLIIKKIFIICNVILVVSVITAGAFKGDISNWLTEQTSEGDSTYGFAPFGALGVVKGAAVAFYGFIGFDRISVSGNEIHKQKRNLPAAILLTIFATLLAYGGVGAVLSLMLPSEKLNPFAAVPFAFQEIGWSAAKWVVVVATFFGFQTSLFGAIFPLPRIIHAMANDGLLLPCFGNTHNTIPLVASMTGGLLAAAGAGIFTFQKLVNLTVIGALFAYTILAINVILLRYSPKSDDDEVLSDSWKNLINKNADVSVKAVVQNYFNFREKHPTNLTEKITMGNVVVFCMSSVGLGAIFNFFYDSLAGFFPEAIVPASILLCIMLFNLISMISQPKSQETLPFKVPLIPFIPCLSIFFNIFLMLTFESITWIMFSSWMAVGTAFTGIIPHFAWRLLKCCRGEMGENSLYEINRTNTVKLNESVWKIKSDKKSFYEGAVNPVFSEDLDERFSEINAEIKTSNESTMLQLKKAEIIQAAEVVMVEKADPLGSELELDFIRVGNEGIHSDIPEESEKVHWECVAEIHTEEEFPQESVALEIVDNTYNFLTEVSEELSKDDISSNRGSSGSGKESLSESENFFKVDGGLDVPSKETKSRSEVPPDKTKDGKQPNDELKMNKKCNGHSDLEREYSDDTDNLKETNFLANSTAKEILLADEFYVNSNFTDSDFDKNKQKELNLMNDKDNLKESQSTVSSPNNIVDAYAKLIPDERSKVKEFREKLNQLLKNHVNNATMSTTNFPLSKPTTEMDDADANNNENDKDALFNSIKTLNKSQIKGKLELLLSKGPPKRPSLRNSFNIKINETNKESDVEKAADETIQNGTTSNDTDAEKRFVVSSSTLQDSIKEKLLALKNVPKDVYC